MHRGGARVEPEFLRGFNDFLAYRGPDAREVWCAGQVGLGHAMLRTTFEAANERQPASLDERYTITADARLDAREELIAKLSDAGRRFSASLPDSLLILHAYAAWGAECIAHLRGDFAFGIWDAHTKTLFCARDHFGIKPFYYAALGDLFLFSNTLNCVRLHPEVSSELNEAAIGDFLLFGLNYNEATTTFRDVQRLPPAHTLTVSAEGIKLRRYWMPPTDGRIRYRRNSEYVEQFQSLLQAAVRDRLRTDRVGILMSGGLDSPALAATAKELSVKAGGIPEIRSYTTVYEHLIPDDEGIYAREVAEFLGISNCQMPMDHLRPCEGWDSTGVNWPEPVSNPFFLATNAQFSLIAKDSRVVFYGEGPDNLMEFQMWPYAADLKRKGEWKRMLIDVPWYFWRRPFPWRGIRSRVQKFFGTDPYERAFPTWLAPDFARRMNLEARWKECTSDCVTPAKHPIHPKGYASMFLPLWTLMFEQQDPGVTRSLLEFRHPYLDLRLVDFLLALSPFPFFFQKRLVRDAMTGWLPESVRRRPKTPVQSDPVLEHVKKSQSTWEEEVRWNQETLRFINSSALGKLRDKLTSHKVYSGLRPHCLNFWLQAGRKVR